MSDKPLPGSNRPAWDAEVTHPDLCEKLRQAFSEITDPELGLNIVQLGLIRNVKIDDAAATIKMILTTPFCPYGPSMLETTRQKAEEVLEREVSIDFGLDPWDFSMMEAGLGGEWGLF
jgi:metal-sulfur cluster biosynthetic enzyme